MPAASSRNIPLPDGAGVLVRGAGPAITDHAFKPAITGVDRCAFLIGFDPDDRDAYCAGKRTAHAPTITVHVAVAVWCDGDEWP